MKIYKCSKNVLKWSDMPQIKYKWILPILINTEYEVILGNSLKDSLPDNIFVVVMDNNNREPLFKALNEIETKIAEENSEMRICAIDSNFRAFFREVRKEKIETISLFEEHQLVETKEITPDNFIDPPPYNFEKHRRLDALVNEGYVLSEEFIEEQIKKDEAEIKVDLEILKELL